jgi:hypothetical protein
MLCELPYANVARARGENARVYALQRTTFLECLAIHSTEREVFEMLCARLNFGINDAMPLHETCVCCSAKNHTTATCLHLHYTADREKLIL